MPQNVLQHKAFGKFYLLETKFYYFWGYPKKWVTGQGNWL
mgnify:CR=1 FL=1